MPLPASITNFNPGNALRAVLARNPKAAGFNIGEYIADLAAGLQNVRAKEADLVRNEADIRSGYERDYGQQVVDRSRAMRDLASMMGSRGLTHSGINLQEQAETGSQYQRAMDRLLAQRNTGLEGIIGGRQANIGGWNAFRNQVEAALAGDAAAFAAGKTVTGAGMPKELPWGFGTSSGVGMTRGGGGGYSGQRMSGPPTSAPAGGNGQFGPPGIEGGFSPQELQYLQALERNAQADQLRNIARNQTIARNTSSNVKRAAAVMQRRAGASTNPVSNIPGVGGAFEALRGIGGFPGATASGSIRRPSGSTRTPNVTGIRRTPTRSVGGGGRFYS